MLVLTRKEGETVHIGHEIVVTVLEVHRGRVRIGIDAPRECRIMRQELQISPSAMNAGSRHESVGMPAKSTRRPLAGQAIGS